MGLLTLDIPFTTCPSSQPPGIFLSRKSSPLGVRQPRLEPGLPQIWFSLIFLYPQSDFPFTNQRPSPVVLLLLWSRSSGAFIRNYSSLSWSHPLFKNPIFDLSQWPVSSHFTSFFAVSTLSPVLSTHVYGALLDAKRSTGGCEFLSRAEPPSPAV